MVRFASDRVRWAVEWRIDIVSVLGKYRSDVATEP
jgi:hypothetical protein